MPHPLLYASHGGATVGTEVISDTWMAFGHNPQVIGSSSIKAQCSGIAFIKSTRSTTKVDMLTPDEQLRCCQQTDASNPGACSPG